MVFADAFSSSTIVGSLQGFNKIMLEGKMVNRFPAGNSNNIIEYWRSVKEFMQYFLQTIIDTTATSECMYLI